LPLPRGRTQTLEFLVNGRTLLTRRVKAGLLDLLMNVPGSMPERRVELRWAATTRIGAKDPRQAAALLKLLGPG
jgi:hypothetical protein